MKKQNIYKLKKTNSIKREDKIMNSKILFSILLSLILINFISANLGSYEQSKCVDIKTILNTTSVTLSTLTYPNGTIPVSDITMQNIAGKTFNYTFCETDAIGTYIYDYYDSEGNVYANSFEITPSGNSGNSNIYFFLFIIIFVYVIALIGFFGKNEIVALLGSFGLMWIGVYIVNNGIIIYLDWLTNGIAYISIGLGAYFGFMAAYSLYQDM